MQAEEACELLGKFAAEWVKLLPELPLLVPSVQATFLLDPAAEKHRLFETLARFISSLAATQHLLIILEDLHWSDELSPEFMHFIARRITALPILFLSTYRSEEDSVRLTFHLDGLNLERLADQLRLTPLTRPEVSQLVQAILKLDHSIRYD